MMPEHCFVLGDHLLGVAYIDGVTHARRHDDTAHKRVGFNRTCRPIRCACSAIEPDTVNTGGRRVGVSVDVDVRTLAAIQSGIMTTRGLSLTRVTAIGRLRSIISQRT